MSRLRVRFVLLAAGFLNGTGCFADKGLPPGDTDETSSSSGSASSSGPSTGDTSSGDTSTDAPTTGPAETCGNAMVDEGEQCDDGNLDDDDGCSNTCALAVCGDARVNGGEQCDDGNEANDDGCLGTCQNATCGDGYVQTNIEVCDQGPDNGAYGGPCNSMCDGPGPLCGDGQWDQAYEQCDGDDAPPGVDCASDCKFTCTFGRGDCNGDASDGCETDLQVSKDHCGMCAQACDGPGDVCVLGACTV